MKQVFNFSAGPAMLPKEVMQQAQHEFCDWHGRGVSIIEMSHRGKDFIEVAQTAEADVRTLLQVPENYHILFCHGGARAQFAAVPLNLLGNNQRADYVDGGYWAKLAWQEAQKYCQPYHIDIRSTTQGQYAVQPMEQWQLHDDAAYLHFCPNETIEGIALHTEPDFDDRITVVADYSSAILSKPIDIKRYGVIYAGAQKNIGPAGITLVIVRDDLLGRAADVIPSILDYQQQVKHGSMFNTPPTFAWYLSGLVFQWLKKQGGLEKIAERNREKAAHLYHFIDQSDFYHNAVVSEYRSWMNVPFQLVDDKLDELFLQEASLSGLRDLKGHRAVGGMRASIYNAMPLEGIFALTEFMADFAKRHG